MFTNLDTNHEGESEDFAFITGQLNGFTEELTGQRDALIAFREQHHATMKEKFERLAQYLEERYLLIESGDAFRRTNCHEPAKCREELLFIFRNQRTFAAQQQAEFPGLSAPRLLAVLDRLIGELERQIERDATIAKNRMRWEANSPTFPSGQGCSRRTAAKNQRIVAGLR